MAKGSGNALRDRRRPHAPEDQIVVGRIGAAHGVKGEIRLKSYTQSPMDVAGYGPLTAEDGRSFVIVDARPAAGPASNLLVVSFKGVDDRAAAEVLNGLELRMARSKLPGTHDDEFYHADLIGLTAVTGSGAPLGTVVAVQNYGAGDLLEIAPARGSPILVPFTREAVPTVDVAAGRIVVDPPPGLLDGKA